MYLGGRGGRAEELQDRSPPEDVWLNRCNPCHFQPCCFSSLAGNGGEMSDDIRRQWGETNAETPDCLSRRLPRQHRREMGSLTPPFAQQISRVLPGILVTWDVNKAPLMWRRLGKPRDAMFAFRSLVC
ncbi:hypothetical protein N658DRAFT_244312 [Parathielavia hyrcaniae]|uniref:Uncharacterized protein n=1 Tax=Parathielavia hyrcaniae TaxID=113614 RepID=A0AAN6Q5Z2_9PEZI|nr:hypothetical protein N658DRAFT_244312 [Parathielavia hyrcaniae]